MKYSLILAAVAALQPVALARPADSNYGTGELDGQTTTPQEPYAKQPEAPSNSYLPPTGPQDGEDADKTPEKETTDNKYPVDGASSTPPSGYNADNGPNGVSGENDGPDSKSPVTTPTGGEGGNSTGLGPDSITKISGPECSDLIKNVTQERNMDESQVNKLEAVAKDGVQDVASLAVVLGGFCGVVSEGASGNSTAVDPTEKALGLWHLGSTLINACIGNQPVNNFLVSVFVASCVDTIKAPVTPEPAQPQLEGKPYNAEPPLEKEADNKDPEQKAPETAPSNGQDAVAGVMKEAFGCLKENQQPQGDGPTPEPAAPGESSTPTEPSKDDATVDPTVPPVSGNETTPSDPVASTPAQTQYSIDFNAAQKIPKTCGENCGALNLMCQSPFAPKSAFIIIVADIVNALPNDTSSISQADTPEQVQTKLTQDIPQEGAAQNEVKKAIDTAESKLPQACGCSINQPTQTGPASPSGGPENEVQGASPSGPENGVQGASPSGPENEPQSVPVPSGGDVGTTSAADEAESCSEESDEPETYGNNDVGGKGLDGVAGNSPIVDEGKSPNADEGKNLNGQDGQDGESA